MRPRFLSRPSLSIAAGFVAFASLSAPGPARAQVDGYLEQAELTGELRALADGSDRVSMSELATSLEGREVWLLEIGDTQGPPLRERPGVLVVGSLEGDHIAGGRLVLEMARHLTGGGGGLDALLSEQVFYLVPRLNPDGVETFFGGVAFADSRNRRPTDDDNDGRTDEDPPEDLNGDGLITTMRVPDTLGHLVPDPADPRLMVEADPAQRRGGGFSIYWEGVDSDGDGFMNEDGSGGVDLNRNFQHAYPYYAPDAGPHMVSEPESRALVDFVVAHRNIAAIVTLGHSDNLVVPPDSDGELADERIVSLSAFAGASNADVFEVGMFPTSSPVGALELRGAQSGADNDPGSGRRPAVVVDDEDLEYFAAASEVYREITGIERVGVHRTPRGAFFQYGYFHYGVPSFSTPGWGIPEPPGGPDPADVGGDPSAEPGPGDLPGQAASPAEPEAPEAELLHALEAGGTEAFVEWAPFEHPDLGPVEIGGFRPYSTTNPPPDSLPDLGRRHGEFLAELARMLPRVRIASAEVESHGGGFHTVRVEVENTGFFPSSLRHGVIAGAVDPITVRIGVPAADLVTGDPLTSRIDRLEGSGSREELSWLIRGEDGEDVEIRSRSQKAGTDVVVVTLGGA